MHRAAAFLVPRPSSIAARLQLGADAWTMQTKWQRCHIGFVAYFLSHTDWPTQLDLDPLMLSWAGDGCRGDLDLAATVCSLAQTVQVRTQLLRESMLSICCVSGRPDLARRCKGERPNPRNRDAIPACPRSPKEEMRRVSSIMGA